MAVLCSRGLLASNAFAKLKPPSFLMGQVATCLGRTVNVALSRPFLTLHATVAVGRAVHKGGILRHLYKDEAIGDLEWGPSLPLLRAFCSLKTRSFSSTSSNGKGEMTCRDKMIESEVPTMGHSSTFLSSAFLNQEQPSSTFALVVLNHQLPLLTRFLWDKACFRICADGGANRIYDGALDFLPSEDAFEVRKRYKPDVIKGDLDSIRPEVKEFYAGLGTEVLDNSGDQDTTDLWKCLSYLNDTLPEIKKERVKIIVLGAFGGRLDHMFAHLNALHLFPTVRIILVSDDSMAFLLPKGFKHEIFINPSVEGPHCGLIPLTGPSNISTTGLKWNVDKCSSHFGGIISTSNIPESNRVTVQADTDLVWTIELQQLYDQLRNTIALKSKAPGDS